MAMVNNFLNKSRKNGVLVASHRGMCGGNIIQNTIHACENALEHGADILEIDVAKTIDGDFFAFHTNQEPGLLGTNQRLDNMTTKQVLDYRLHNSIQEVTSQKVNTLDDILEHFKSKCLINLDRSWFYWEDIIRHIHRRGMRDQIILKSHPKEDYLKLLKDSQTNIMYMPILLEGQLERQHLEHIFWPGINLMAVEVIFQSEKYEFAQQKFIEAMHAKGILLWVNALTLNDNTVLSSGHDDNCAILQNTYDGWGWLIDRGFDIISTDWPMLLKSYAREFENNITYGNIKALPL
jgi:glycerophosphoryl diester phosphodiesterase